MGSNKSFEDLLSQVTQGPEQIEDIYRKRSEQWASQHYLIPMATVREVLHERGAASMAPLLVEGVDYTLSSTPQVIGSVDHLYRKTLLEALETANSEKEKAEMEMDWRTFFGPLLSFQSEKVTFETLNGIPIFGSEQIPLVLRSLPEGSRELRARFYVENAGCGLSIEEFFLRETRMESRSYPARQAVHPYLQRRWQEDPENRWGFKGNYRPDFWDA